MAKPDDISSTERLLNLIRKKNSNDKFVPSRRNELGGSRTKIARFFPFGKRETIGVDIHYDDLKLVKIQQSSDKDLELLDYVTVPFEPDMSPSSSRFAQFLKQTLSNFCGATKNPQIWSIFSSARVEAHYLRIPQTKKADTAAAVFWAYRKKSTFEEKEKIFDFDILGEVIEQGVPKIEVLAYTAPEHEIIELKNRFSNAGYPLTGISIAPFALQNLFKTGWIQTKEPNVSSLYIGRSWSRIDIFSGGDLVLSRGIKAGMKSMIESIRAEIEESQFESTLALLESDVESRSHLFENSMSMSAEDATEIFSAFLNGKYPLEDRLSRYPLDEAKTFQMILPALERLIRQVERTLEHFSHNFEGSAVGRIFVSGRTSSHNRLVAHIGEQLGLPTEAINPFPREASIAPVVRRPESVAEKDALAPAVGMALSSNEITPNFIYTRKEREQSEKYQTVNKALLAVSVLLMIIFTGVYLWQSHIVSGKEARNETAQRDMDKNAAFANKNVLVQMVARAARNGQELSRYAATYRSIAILGEISRITPTEIRLTAMDVQNGKPATKLKPAEPPSLFVAGVIFGSQLEREASFASYLETVKKSPLFKEAEILEKLSKTSTRGELLSFHVRIDVK